MASRKLAITVALGLGQTLAFASSYYLAGVLADPMARDLGVKPSLIFGLMSLALLASAVVGPFLGRWIDRHGGRPLLLLSSVVFAVGLTVLGLAHGAVALTLGWVLLGVGMSIGVYETPFAILAALYGMEARRPITAVALLGGLGSTVGWTLTQALTDAFDWRGACFAWALLHGLVSLPAIALIVPRARSAAPASARPVGAAGIWDRGMVQMAVLFALTWFVSTCIGAHLPRLLAGFGLPMREAVAAAALLGVASVSARVLDFALLSKAHPLLATRAATLLHPLGALALVAFGPPAGAIFALAQGAGNGILTVSKGVLPLALYGPEGYGYRSGLLATPAKFLQAGGPLIYGLLLDRSPQLALGVSAACCLLMFAATFGLRRAQQAEALGA